MEWKHSKNVKSLWLAVCEHKERTLGENLGAKIEDFVDSAQNQVK